MKKQKYKELSTKIDNLFYFISKDVFILVFVLFTELWLCKVFICGQPILFITYARVWLGCPTGFLTNMDLICGQPILFITYTRVRLGCPSGFLTNIDHILGQPTLFIIITYSRVRLGFRPHLWLVHTIRKGQIKLSNGFAIINCR